MFSNDRFSPSSNWQKLLFRPDKKTQVAELNEIQSLLNYQISNNLEYLFYAYKIIKGLTITLSSFTSTGYSLTLNGGQVFIIQDDVGYFLDIPDTTFEVPFNAKKTLVVNLVFTTQTGLKDPLITNLPGPVGADRLVLSPSVSTDVEGYPLAIILGQGFGQHPYIFYYTNQGYSLEYSTDYISSFVKDYVALRQYEETGDFIASGLDISLSSDSLVTVCPGVAYINGSPITTYYPYSFLYSKTQGDILSLYLNNKGYIITDYAKSRKIPNALFLGTVFQHTTLGFGLPQTNLYSLNTTTRALSNSDLKLLSTQVSTNQDSILDILLQQEVFSTFTNLTNGILTDNFINLNNSDIYYPSYSSTIIPKYKLLRPSFVSSIIDFDNVTVTTNSNVTLNYKNGIINTIYPSFTENVILDQSRATNYITLTTINTSATITVNPPNGTPQTNTVDYQSLSTLEPTNSQFLTDPYLQNITITSVLNTTLVTIDGYGFDSYEDNLAVVFGNVKILSFTIVKGTAGSTIGTVMASIDGSFTLSFNVPPNLQTKDYSIQVSNDTTSATTSFRSTTSSPILLEYGSNIGQSFTIDFPILISKLKLALRDVPSLLTDSDIAIITIVTVLNGSPTTNVLGQTILTIAEAQTSSDGSILSSATFDLPIYLNQGNYAFLISPLTTQPISFYYGEIGQPALNSIAISDTQPLIGGELLLYQNNTWISDLSKDLTFQLIQAIPISNLSTLNFTISNPLGFINYIQNSVTETQYPSSCIQYFYNSNGTYLPLADSQFIPNNQNTLQLQITFISTSNVFSAILANQSYFTIDDNNLNGTWVSKEIEYDKTYTNVEIQIEEFYQPIGTSINFFFTSNSGQTWEPIPFHSSTLFNNNIPTSTGNWVATGLFPTVVTTDISGNTSNITRTKIKLRVEFTSKSKDSIPFIRKLKGIVY